MNKLFEELPLGWSIKITKTHTPIVNEKRDLGSRVGCIIRDSEDNVVLHWKLLDVEYLNGANQTFFIDECCGIYRTQG